MNDALKNVRICLKEFEVKYGRMPSTKDEIDFVKGQAEMMAMIDEAMIEPEFLDEETDWLEA